MSHDDHDDRARPGDRAGHTGSDRHGHRRAGAPISRRRFVGQLGMAGAAGAWLATPMGRSRGAHAASAAGERSVGYAVVGIGKLSQGQIIPALKSTRFCRLAALVSGHPDKARKVAAENGVPEKNIYSYETYDRLADNPEVDVVYVVLPNAMHAEYTIRAARAGKHVYCEKPMAVSSRECQEMIAACKKAGRQLGIGYRLHFEPYNLELVRLARTGELGAIKVIDAAACVVIGDPSQWRLDRKLSGGGSLVDIGIYAQQAARYISGEEPVSVSARQTIMDHAKFKGLDESMTFSMTFPSGVIATCLSGYSSRYTRFEVGAEAGSFGLEPALYYHGIQGFRSDGKPMKFPDIDQFATEMDDFAQGVRSGRATRVPGEEGLRDVRIIEALYRSAETGRDVKL
jgi:predicted dehydrogenase